MDAQRARARSAQKKEVIGAAPKAMELETNIETEFLGYSRDTCVGSVQEILTEGDNVYVVVNRSTFYAEMGGQVGDAGVILGSANKRIPIANTIRRGTSQFLRLENPADRERTADRARGFVGSRSGAAPERSKAIIRRRTCCIGRCIEVVGTDVTRSGAPTSARTGCGSISIAAR